MCQEVAASVTLNIQTTGGGAPRTCSLQPSQGRRGTPRRNAHQTTPKPKFSQVHSTSPWGGAPLGPQHSSGRTQQQQQQHKAPTHGDTLAPWQALTSSTGGCQQIRSRAQAQREGSLRFSNGKIDPVDAAAAAPGGQGPQAPAGDSTAMTSPGEERGGSATTTTTTTSNRKTWWDEAKLKKLEGYMKRNLVSGGGGRGTGGRGGGLACVHACMHACTDSCVF